ncbi:MAG: ABC transporter ATP-binding protein [Clostridiales bacterium]|nr:ABC transporter ATP-binding protein [Clostridiales bacterium]
MENNVILEARQIQRTYGKGKAMVQALKRCSLSFQKGEFVAIVGKSGSGKSTLLRILGTMDLPDKETYSKEETRIEIGGENVLDMNDAALSEFRRRRIGFIFQDYSLFPEFTLYENVIMPLHLDGRGEDPTEVEELLKQLDIWEQRDQFPGELSGGEQQRCAIARALLPHPAVIFADEPTGNLDAQNALEVVMMLKKASQLYHQTIIMVTHDSQMAEFADRILHISNGEIQEAQK